MISYYILLSYTFPREFFKEFEKTRGIFIFLNFFHEKILIFLEIILKFSWKISPLKKVVTTLTEKWRWIVYKNAEIVD